MVMVPTTDESFTGSKVTGMRQTAAGWMVPQVSPALTVVVEDTRLARSNGALPQLVRRTTWVLDFFAGTSPKFTFQVSRHTDGAGVAISNLATKPWLALVGGTV
jgi:hypothetical protein